MSDPQAHPVCPDQLRTWLTAAVEAGASDLHVVAGHPPVLRVHGQLRQLDATPLQGPSVRRELEPLCPPHAMKRFQNDKNADFAFELDVQDQAHRFRANYFLSGEQVGACFRVIPSVIPDFRWAGFPALEPEHLLLLGEREDWEAEKEARRAHVAERYRILMLVGDNLGDFVPAAIRGGTPGERSTCVSGYREMWGKKWFVLPNPAYGSWRQILKEPASECVRGYATPGGSDREEPAR